MSQSIFHRYLRKSTFKKCIQCTIFHLKVAFLFFLHPYLYDEGRNILAFPVPVIRACPSTPVFLSVGHICPSLLSVTERHSLTRLPPAGREDPGAGQRGACPWLAAQGHRHPRRIFETPSCPRDRLWL